MKIQKTILCVLMCSGALMIQGCQKSKKPKSSETPTPTVPTTPTTPTSPTIPTTTQLKGQVEEYQNIKNQKVEILTSEGKIYLANIDEKGEYSIFNVPVSAPYLIRVENQDGQYIYAVSDSNSKSNILNINKISNLLTYTISPNNNPELLWKQQVSERKEQIDDKYSAALNKLEQSISPVLAILNAEQTNVLNHEYRNKKIEFENILNNIQVNITEFDSQPSVIALSTASNTSNVVLWDSSLTQYQPVTVTDAEDIVDFSTSIITAQKHYDDLKTDAGKYNPKNIDVKKFEEIKLKLMAEADRAMIGDFSLDRFLALVKEHLIVMTVPEKIADDMVNALRRGDLDNYAELVEKTMGEDISKDIEKYKNMSVDILSTNATNKTIKFKINLGGEVKYETWSVSGQLFDQLKGKVESVSHCIKGEYEGTALRPTPEYYIQNTIFKNKCNYPVSYVSCVWRAKEIGGGSCHDYIYNEAKAGQSTNIPNVLAGPLWDKRIFFACPEPFKPILDEQPFDKRPFELRWYCG